MTAVRKFQSFIVDVAKGSYPTFRAGPLLEQSAKTGCSSTPYSGFEPNFARACASQNGGVFLAKSRRRFCVN